MKYSTIFFDFDGVIAESVNIKTEAFFQLYLPFGEAIANSVRQHHLENGGVSRFEKFRLYHKKYLDIDLDKNGIEYLSTQFSHLVLEGVIKAPEVKGLRDFLNRYQSVLSMWVITGTPTEEIRIIIERKKLGAYFKGSYGSPEKKGYWTDRLISENNLKPDACLFVGDAMADYEAAKANGIDFALRETFQNVLLFRGINNIYRFNDFTDLEACIKANL